MGHFVQIQICPIVKKWQNGCVYGELQLERSLMISKLLKTMFFSILIAIFILTPLYFYFSEFGPLSKYTWPNNQSWANFGSFVGGTIGPLLSLVAFIGIWKTYNLQNQQLILANNQRKSDDIQRLITESAHRIDTILDSPFDILSAVNDKSEGVVHDFTKAIYTLSGMLNKEGRHFNKHKAEILKKKMTLEIKQICIEADNLSWLLLYNQTIFDEMTIVGYYNFRYRNIFYHIQNAGFELFPRITIAFDLPEKNKVAE